MTKTTLSTKGQIVLPQAIRAQLGLVAGNELEVTIQGDTLVLRRVSRFPTKTLADAVGSIAYDGPTRSVDEMNEAVAEMFRARASKS